jgi:hypothetical protein
LRVSRLGLFVQLPGDALIVELFVLKNHPTGEWGFSQVVFDTGLGDRGSVLGDRSSGLELLLSYDKKRL